MKTVATIVAMFLFASVASAQTQAAMATKLHEVKQGAVIPFDITVKPAPNLQGHVTLYAKSDTSGMETNAGQGINPDQSAIQSFALTIPTNATTGKWTVARVMFRPDAGGPEKSLNVALLPSFEVVERKAVEPDSAVVEVK
jgi:hypothetical protein